MSIDKPAKIIVAGNILVGLHFGFLFFEIATWGIDDDAEFAKVAWGHVAAHRAQQSASAATQVALFCLGLTWLFHFAVTRSFIKTTTWAVALAVVVLLLILLGSLMGCIQFYTHRPVGW